ncbi:MAG: hypothetical protein WCV00_24455 [Verrucomicrobiia bacterium]|jgi:hypothetical protein
MKRLIHLLGIKIGRKLPERIDKGFVIPQCREILDSGQTETV